MSTICYQSMLMDDPPETSELLTFARTVEARSISRAARELGVPRPTVGRRLARLEQKLGVKLLRRTTRAMALTDAGEALYARARVVLAAVRDAELSVRRSDEAVRGLLRVSAPPRATDSFGAMVSDFLTRFPEVRLELDMSARHVDLIAEGYDLAIRAASELPPGLVARRLLRSRQVAVATPAYLAEKGAPKRVTELAKHACLVGFERGEHPVTHWPMLRGGKVRVEPTLASNALEVIHAAALAGRGIAMLPLMVVYDDLEAGRLAAVLPERLGSDVHIAAVYPDREFVSPALRAFIDAVVAWAKSDAQFSRELPPCPAHKCAAKKATKPRTKR
ncbi:MAG: LysR family transcriptional regulator [Polyangiales bacterium]